MTRNKTFNKIRDILKSNKSVIQTSYDIIKAHGGDIKVSSKENEGSEFIILLPLKQQV